MTVEEAKDYLITLLKSSGITVNEAMALIMAIKSLEAWEKVKKEIKNAKPVYPDIVKIWGTDTIIGIIDKYLSEVSG